MAKRIAESVATEPVAESTPGIRSTLRALTLSASHRARSNALGHQAEAIVIQVDEHLTSARNALVQLASTAAGAEAIAILEIVERLA